MLLISDELQKSFPSCFCCVHSFAAAAAAAAKSLQLCPTLCDSIDGSLPGSSVPGILQAKTLEWVAISFSNAWKWKVKVKSLSRVRLLAIPWTAAYQAPLSMGVFRQEYWNGLLLPSLYILLHMVKFISDFAEFCVMISFAVHYKWILPLFLLFCGFMLPLKSLTCLKFTEVLMWALD